MSPCTILDPNQAAKAAISENLTLPEIDYDGRIKTLNHHGSMKFNIMSKTAEGFIGIASQPGAKVLDVGVAFGEVLLKALAKGARNVTAIDMEEGHLKILARRIMEEMPDKMGCLRLIQGRIPSDELDEIFGKKEEKFDAILVDSVLHFLRPEEIAEVKNF